MHQVKRYAGRGRRRQVVYEDKPSQEWTDLPPYLRSRDPRALHLDELADALDTSPADLAETLRTISTIREAERQTGAAGLTEERAGRSIEREAERAAEAEAAEYMARRGEHPRLADLGIVGAHPHSLRVWHIGPEGSGEWFRPFGRLAAGVRGPGENAPKRKPAPSTQAEMFTARQMVPAILPGKLRTDVPQAASGDELLAGFRRPAEEEKQVSLFGNPYIARPVNFESRYPLAIQLAVETWSASGPRTKERLISLVRTFGEQYGLEPERIEKDIERTLALYRENPDRLRHRHIDTVPRGWHVRTVTRGGALVRLAFPPGRRKRGAGRLVSILRLNPRVWSTDGRNKTPNDAALEFAQKYFAEPRKIEGFSQSKRGTWVFRLVHGTQEYRVFTDPKYPDDWIIARGEDDNPAYSAYFLRRGGSVTEKYFNATNLTDAKRQIAAYARAHGLQPSTLWQLRHTTRVGRRFAGEWARPLTERQVNDMAHWLDNPRHRRHRHNRRHRRRHYHNRRHYRRHRHNPEGGLLSATGAIGHPTGYVMQAAWGLVGAFTTVVGGNFAGNALLPSMYNDPSVTGKAVRAAVRLGVGYGVDMLAKGMHGAQRAAMRVGMGIGIAGSFLLDLLGTSFVVGSGDSSQSIGGLLSQFGISAGGAAGTGAYMMHRRGANIVAGVGAYVDKRTTGNTIAGLGDVAMYGVGDSLLYRPFR